MVEKIICFLFCVVVIIVAGTVSVHCLRKRNNSGDIALGIGAVLVAAFFIFSAVLCWL